MMSSRTFRPLLSTLRQFSGEIGYGKRGSIHLRSSSRSLFTDFSKGRRYDHQNVRLGPLMGVAALAASGIGIINYFGREESTGTGSVLLPRLQAAEKKGEDGPKQKVPLRERRYKKFASIVYNGEPYMTPRDFVESLMQDEPRSKFITSVCRRLTHTCIVVPLCRAYHCQVSTPTESMKRPSTRC